MFKPPSERLAKQLNDSSSNSSSRIKSGPILIALSGKSSTSYGAGKGSKQRRQTRLRLTRSTNNSDEDEEEIVNSSTATGKRRLSANKTIVIASSSDGDQNTYASESDHQQQATPRPRQSQQLIIGDEEEEDEEEERSPKQNRNVGKQRRLLKAAVVQEEDEIRQRSAIKYRNQAALQALKHSQLTNTAAARRRRKYNTTITAEESNDSSNTQSIINYSNCSSSSSSSDESSLVGGEDEDNEALDAQLRKRQLSSISHNSSNRTISSRNKRIIRTRVINDSDVELAASGSDDSESGQDRNSVADGEQQQQQLPFSEDDGFIVRSSKRHTAGADNWHSQMPTRFSNMTKQPLSALFPILVQLVAGEHLNRGFMRDCLKRNRGSGDNIDAYGDDDDQYFTFASDKLDGTVEALKNSLVKSQCWAEPFRNALDALPQLFDYDMAAEDGCDACNRRNRVSTKQLTLTGVLYNRRTLLPVKRGKKEQKVEFQVGRECFRRAQLYHQLHHYRWQLKQRVAEELDAMKPPAFNPQDGEQQSSLVMQLLGDQLIMSQLFGGFKEMLERAESSYAA